ncbi:MAG TPA: hypothetical protein VND62_11370 [Acidimicrobiales bacterium]|nr:hypothetical protein [Acidimicrobiales bacterium]
MSPTLEAVAREGRDELTPAEAQQFADEQTREYLGLSLSEFRRLAATGELSTDDPMVVHIALIAGVDLPRC